MRNVSARWALMTLYERFEQVVAIALSLIIAILILIALVQLYERVLPLGMRPGSPRGRDLPAQHRRERGRHQFPDRRIDDRRVERLGRIFAGASGPGGTEA